MSMISYDYNGFNLWCTVSRQSLFSTQCILIAELDDVRSERGGDCFQPKRNCGISFRTYVGDWGDVLVFYIWYVQLQMVNLIYRQEMLQSQTATSHVRSIGSELRPSQGENRAFDETQQVNGTKLNQKAPIPHIWPDLLSREFTSGDGAPAHK